MKDLNLRLFSAHYENIQNPLFLVAENIEVAMSDAHIFAHNSRLLAVNEIADKVHIDFRRENERIEEFIKPKP